MVLKGPDLCQTELLSVAVRWPGFRRGHAIIERRGIDRGAWSFRVVVKMNFEIDYGKIITFPLGIPEYFNCCSARRYLLFIFAS
uniref:Uncharacterized protein n=1 Tax=Candidatus Kentrum sp. FW TaxID=2126338 RepID=A0A450T474_9GAMM|nr:MAG: hypothetical protein BECKFW1821C_GA0114237_100152 [Candidatus Kentron sp. FW]